MALIGCDVCSEQEVFCSSKCKEEAWPDHQARCGTSIEPGGVIEQPMTRYQREKLKSLNNIYYELGQIRRAIERIQR